MESLYTSYSSYYESKTSLKNKVHFQKIDAAISGA